MLAGPQNASICAPKVVETTLGRFKYLDKQVMANQRDTVGVDRGHKRTVMAMLNKSNIRKRNQRNSTTAGRDVFRQTISHQQCNSHKILSYIQLINRDLIPKVILEIKQYKCVITAIQCSTNIVRNNMVVHSELHIPDFVFFPLSSIIPSNSFQQVFSCWTESFYLFFK